VRTLNLLVGVLALAIGLWACSDDTKPAGAPASQGGGASDAGDPGNTDEAGETGDAGRGEMEEGPGLAVGDAAPDVTLYTQSGEAVALSSLNEEQGPLVLTFYRGGWCPFCSEALEGWQARLDELREAGATFVAVSPESPDHMGETVEKLELGYMVLGDPDHEAAEAFEVGFTVDEVTKAKYKDMGLDVGAWNADNSWNLPAPGTFVIDREGVIRWAFADWDYKNRADPSEVIAFVRTME